MGDMLKIPPLWASLALMALRYLLLGAGIDTAATADAHAQQLWGAFMVIASLVWAIVAKLHSQAQKRALAAAHPSEVVLPNGQSAATTLSALIVGALIVVGLIGVGSTLSACTTAGTYSAPVRATAARSLIVADTAFDSTVLLAEQGVRAGKLKGATAGQVRTLLAQMHAALTAAHDAYAVGSTTDVTARLAAFDDLRAQALRLIPPKA